MKFEPSAVITLVYVDDILVTGPNSTLCKAFINKLGQLFLVKDLGALHYFLGLEVTRTAKGIFLSQNKYAMDILIKTHMEGNKSCTTPIGTRKLDHTSSLLPNPHEC